MADTKIEWISVNDRLPEVEQKVIGIGLYKGKQTRADVLYYDGPEGWWDTLRHIKVTGEVTHWMPIPEPPQTPTGGSRD